MQTMKIKDLQNSSKCFVWVAVCLLALASSAEVLGQSSGTITGTVTDQSQAITPGATVLLIDEGTNDTRRSVSNSEGYFSFTALQAKTYKLRVELPGFQAWERPGIVLTPGSKINISDIVLMAGAQNETVTVTADAGQIAPLDSGEKSAVISSKEIQNTTILGRSAAELIKILPGMTAVTGLDNRPGFSGEAIGINGNGDGGKQSALGNFSANGTRTESMDIVSDGAHVSDPGCNCATPVNPNPDMIQEFKVLQSNFGAENAKGPVVMSAVSKSGTSEFHGTAYYFLRHWKMNSNEWLLNANSQERPKNKYNFPGFNIGGPVLFPGTGFNKKRDKMFFFFGTEYYGQTLDTGVLRSRVPTDAMRNGDFSDAAYLAKLNDGQVNAMPQDQNGIVGIQNGRIPTNLIDPGGRVLMNLLPQPNVTPNPATGGFNYVKALTLAQNGNQEWAKVDYNFSDKTKLFVRYSRQAELQQFPVGLWWRNAGQVPYPTPTNAENRSQSVSASLTNIFSPTLTNEIVFGLTYINFPNSFDDPSKISRSKLNYPYKGIFKNSLDQIPSVVGAWGGGPTILNPGGFDPVLFARKWLGSGSDNLTKVYKTHTMKFGAYWEMVTNNQPGNNNSNGQLEFATWSGNSSGNMLADLLMGRGINTYNESTKNALHNIAFRTIDFFAQDSWKMTPKFTLEYGMRFSHLGPWYNRDGNGLVIFDPSRYNPNAKLEDNSGLVWHAKDSSIPLSGNKGRALFYMPRLGFAYNLFGAGKTVLRGGFGVFTYHDPQQPYDAVIDIGAGVRQTTASSPITLRDLENYVPSAVKIGPGALDPRDNRQPTTYSWSYTIQQQLASGTMLEASYVGNKSQYLMNRDSANINVVPLGAMLKDPSGDPDSYRPYKLYQGINFYRHDQYQNYNGLQVLLNRQKGRFNFLSSYTFSKSLGIRGGAQGARADSLDIRRHNYGILAYDRTHVFNVSYSILLPDFAKNWMGGNKVAGGFLDGWQFSGITQFASGFPLQASNTNFSPSGTVNGVDIGNTRVIAGTPDTTVQPFITCDPREGLRQDQYINPNCFAPPTPGRNGDYIFPYLKGPMYQNHDLSLFKNFEISEHKKFQVRFQAYNFLNHPLPSLSDQNLHLDFNAQGKVSNQVFGSTSGNKFGRRIVQLGFKFYF